MDCGALEDVLRGARAGAILLKVFFFSFIFLSPNVPMCLSVSASSFLIDAQAHLPDLRQETGPTHDVAYQKETVYKRLAE